MTGDENNIDANQVNSPEQITGKAADSSKSSVFSRLAERFSSLWQVKMEDNNTQTSNQLAESRTDLASKRTLMAADRTLMAWVRTALSMISFGFTIYKVLESLHGSAVNVVIKTTPENVGLFLIGLGTISMTLGTIEYWQNIKEIRRKLHFSIIRPAFIMAFIISITGALIFISVIANFL